MPILSLTSNVARGAKAYPVGWLMHKGTGVPLASHAPHVASTYSRPGGAITAMRGLSEPAAEGLSVIFPHKAFHKKITSGSSQHSMFVSWRAPYEHNWECMRHPQFEVPIQ